ncbi:TPA: phage tail spike protein [Streptococcus suis]
MIYLFDKDEKLIKIVRKSAVKTALQKYALTTERYVSDRLTVELKGLNADELEQVEYMAIQTMEDAHTFHYFYVAQKFSDSLTTLIGVQSGIEELRKSPVFDKRPKNALARDVITDLLAGTNWRARFAGETTPHSTNFYYTSIFDALKKVCEVWDLEMQFFVEMNGNRIGARYIDFKRRIGEAVGKRVVYGHNALQILQEVERTNIFTALVGRGKGEETGDGYGRKITFENVVWSRTQGKPVDKPKGQKYLELPLMTRQYGIKNADGTMRPKIGFVDFSEEENPEVLIERTYKALIDAARPQLTLKTSSVYLRGVKVGDTIRVVRHDKKLDYDTRIFEITFNRLNNQSSDIKLGDRIGESNEAKVQTIADKAVEQFVNNEFSNFVQNLPDYLPSADGFNNNWYGAEDPTVKYPGKVLINDIWFKPDPEHEGHKIMLRWTGEVWEEILRTYESEALRERIAEEIAQVNQSMQAQSEEHDRQVANILSKTQSVEALANQAKSDAASALARANQVKTEAIADARAQIATVSQALNTAKSELQTAIASADQKARDSQASATALRNDLNSQANKILAQAQAQTALTNRVSAVETLADGTRSTVTELSKTVDKATGDIASVTSRTKTVEDTLSQTRTQYEALTQTVNAQTGQIDSINRKTADLQSGIDGVREKFENIKIGSRNYLRNASFISNSQYWYRNQDQNLTYNLNHSLTNKGKPGLHMYSSSDNAVVGRWKGIEQRFKIQQPANTDYVLSLDLAKDGVSTDANIGLHFRKNGEIKQQAWFYVSKSEIQTSYKRFVFKTKSTFDIDEINVMVYVGYDMIANLYVTDVQLEVGNIASDFQLSDEDLRSEFATYIRTATENSAELVRRIETADGKAVDAKSYAQQTAEGFKSRIESLETYKDAEGTRASQYLTASRTETAKQIAAERTAIATDYVAKSTYTEDVRGTTQRLNEIKSTADTAKQNLATYQETVDRKLTELTSSTQTLDGKISTASSKVDTVAGQIRTEISEVEGKIPTDFDGLNLMTGTRDWSTKANPWHMGTGWVIEQNEHEGLKVHSTQRGFNGSHQNIFVKTGDVVTFSFFAKATQPLNNVKVSATWTGSSVYQEPVARVAERDDVITISDSWKRYSKTVHVTSDGSLQFRTEFGSSTIPNGIKLYIAGLKLAKSSVDTGYSENPTDLMTEIASVKTTITQTASGIEQLSSSLATTDSKVTTAEAKIRNLVDEVSSKVSQTDYNTLTGRVDNNETAITQNAQEISKRLTKTQVDKAITDKGYQTKSDVDNNITGRGYITSSALQPYALATTVQTLVRETADSFSRTISETRALIPTSAGSVNYIRDFSFAKNHNFSNNQSSWRFERIEDSTARSGYHIKATCTQSGGGGFHRVLRDLRGAEWQGRTMTYSIDIKASKAVRMRLGVEAFNKGYKAFDVTTDWQRFISTDTVNLKTYYSFPFYTDSVQWQVDDVIYLRDPQLEDGSIATTAHAAEEDLATVTALHNVEDTVSSHTRTIGAIGETGSILDNVSKVTQTANGLVTEVSGENGLKTQVSTLAGSYAIKSLTKAGDVLGQINLNKDGSVKIDGSLVQITGKTYIENGVIDAAKIGDLDAGKIKTGTLDAARIKANTIDGSKIVFDDAFFSGLTASEANLQTLFSKDAFITQVQAVTLSASKIQGGVLEAVNGAMKMDLNNGQISFLQDTASIRRASSRSASQFMRFEDSGLTTMPGSGISAAHTILGSNYLGSESSGNAFAGLEIYSGKYESLSRVVGDRIEFRANQGNKNLDNGNWVMDFKNRGDSYFYPQKGANTKNTYLGHMNSRITNVYVQDINLRNGQSLHDILHLLASIAGHIVLGGFSDDTYRAIKDTYNNLRDKGYG